MFITEPEFVNFNFFKEPRTRFRNRFRNLFLGSLKVYKFWLLCNSTVCGGGGILGDQYSNTSSVTRYRNYRIRELWEFILREPFTFVREIWEFIMRVFHWCQRTVGVHRESLPLVSEK
jgi:hypothetical protein